VTLWPKVDRASVASQRAEHPSFARLILEEKNRSDLTATQTISGPRDNEQPWNSKLNFGARDLSRKDSHDFNRIELLPQLRGARVLRDTLSIRNITKNIYYVFHGHIRDHTPINP
jgi:hypothetical protein